MQPLALRVHVCRADRSYIITGALGGFGLALAVWLAKQGARNLVLTSKRGMRTGTHKMIVRGLQAEGVKVALCPVITCCFSADHPTPDLRITCCMSVSTSGAICCAQDLRGSEPRSQILVLVRAQNCLLSS
jgi:NAD(P)-dependent dehydrogenase (short-subunit alcohol dehydrogenase family)